MQYRLDENGQWVEWIDKIDEFWDVCYLSAGEVAWRIMGFQVMCKDPAVMSIPVHLPESWLYHQYHQCTGPGSTVSLLNHHFCCPTGSFQLWEQPQNFSELTYTQYYSLFCLQKFDACHDRRPGYFPEQSHNGPAQHVILRSSGHWHLSCIKNVWPSEGEQFICEHSYGTGLHSLLKISIPLMVQNTALSRRSWLHLDCLQIRMRGFMHSRRLSTLYKLHGSFVFCSYTCLSMTVYQPLLLFGMSSRTTLHMTSPFGTETLQRLALTMHWKRCSHI